MTRTESEASLGLSLILREDEEDPCLKLPTLRSHSAISKFVGTTTATRPNSRPKSGFSLNDDCLCAAAINQQALFAQNFGVISVRQNKTSLANNNVKNRVYQVRKKPSIEWKDLRKSICLNFNSEWA